jgi:hypothetical protein
VIPPNGNIAIRCVFPNNYRLPTGTPVPLGGGSQLGDPGVTYAWGDASQFQPATPWQVNADHQPELGYLSHLLFRDPWDLHTIQAGAMSSANGWPTMHGGTVRQQSWDYAHAAQAWAATPDNVPPWLIPRSTLERWIQVIQKFFSTHWLDGNDPAHPEGAGMRAVFHTPQWFLSEGLPTKARDGTELAPTGTAYAGWQDGYFLQAASLAAMLRPHDATAQRILAFSAKGVGDRYGGDPGWPKGAWTGYQLRVRDSETSPIYATLAEAWAGNRPMWWLYASGNRLPDPIPPDPVDTISIPKNISNYPTGDFAGLSLAVQAGLTQYKPQRDWLGPACRRAGVNFNRAFAQV